MTYDAFQNIFNGNNILRGHVIFAFRGINTLKNKRKKTLSIIKNAIRKINFVKRGKCINKNLFIYFNLFVFWNENVLDLSIVERPEE